MTASLVLKSITIETKDGEWGEEEPFESSVQMAVIRGTDFESVRTGVLADLPIRHIPERIAIRKTLRPYDILIETAGGSKDRPTGRTLLVKPSLLAKSELPLTCASFARFIRIDPDKVDPSYVFWLLQHLYQGGFIRQYNTQHTGVARFQFTTFAEREPLTLPVKPVQNRIAAILSAYDDLIENNTSRISLLEEMAQMIYREWFINFRFPGHQQVKMVDSVLGRIPEKWEVKTLDQVMDFQGGSQPPKSEWIDEPREGFVRMIQIRDYQSDRYKCYVKDSKTLRKCTEDDIMIARYGASVARICWGLTGAYNVALVRVEPVSLHLKEFLRSYLQSETFQSLLIGMSGRTAQAGFNKSNLKSVQLAIPQESSLFVEYENVSAPLRRLTLTLRKTTETASKTRDFLLQKLISGEIRVEESEVEAVAQGV